MFNRERHDIKPLHFITNETDDYTHIDACKKACAAGVKVVQLRVKEREYGEWLKIAQETLACCRSYGAQCIINDNVDIAKEIGADGVHLGKLDMAPDLARLILGKDAIIGITANTPEDVRKGVQYDVDYIGLGPYRFTKTKLELEPVLGEEGVEAGIKVANSVPVIVVGGVTFDDISKLKALGAHGVAMSSALLNTQSESLPHYEAFSNS